MLISKALYSFNVFATLEEQPTSLLVTHDYAATVYDGRNDPTAARETSRDPFFTSQQTVGTYPSTIQLEQNDTDRALETQQKTPMTSQINATPRP